MSEEPPRASLFQRVKPVDPAQRLQVTRLVPLVLVETAGLAMLFALYRLLHVSGSVLAPIVIPPIVSFVLVFATAHTPASRPLRVFTSYVIAAIFGLGMAAIPGPRVVDAVIAAALTLFAMHGIGAFHAPAIAVSMASVLGEPTWQDAIRAFPLLLGTVVLVLLMAWAAHKILGDETYPVAWW